MCPIPGTKDYQAHTTKLLQLSANPNKDYKSDILMDLFEYTDRSNIINFIKEE